MSRSVSHDPAIVSDREMDQRIRALAQRYRRQSQVTVRFVDPATLPPARHQDPSWKRPVAVSRRARDYGTTTCDTCGRMFERRSAQHRYCSPGCQPTSKRRRA